MIIVEAGRAAELRERLMARIKQSINFFYPARERTPTDERPQLTFSLGMITAQQSLFTDGDALKEACLTSVQPVV